MGLLAMPGLLGRAAHGRTHPHSSSVRGKAAATAACMCVVLVQVVPGPTGPGAGAQRSTAGRWVCALVLKNCNTAI